MGTLKHRRAIQLLFPRSCGSDHRWSLIVSRASTECRCVLLTKTNGKLQNGKQRFVVKTQEFTFACGHRPNHQNGNVKLALDERHVSERFQFEPIREDTLSDNLRTREGFQILFLMVWRTKRQGTQTWLRKRRSPLSNLLALHQCFKQQTRPQWWIGVGRCRVPGSFGPFLPAYQSDSEHRWPTPDDSRSVVTIRVSSLFRVSLFFPLLLESGSVLFQKDCACPRKLSTVDANIDVWGHLIACHESGIKAVSTQTSDRALGLVFCVRGTLVVWTTTCHATKPEQCFLLQSGVEGTDQRIY